MFFLFINNFNVLFIVSALLYCFFDKIPKHISENTLVSNVNSAFSLARN